MILCALITFTLGKQGHRRIIIYRECSGLFCRLKEEIYPQALACVGFGGDGRGRLVIPPTAMGGGGINGEVSPSPFEFLFTVKLARRKMVPSMTSSTHVQLLRNSSFLPIINKFINENSNHLMTYN